MRGSLHVFFACAVVALAAPFAAAQPSVLAVTNNYSYTLPGMPSFGIAQGSVFVVWGTKMAGGTAVAQNLPLQTTLSGVTVNVTVGGTTTHPPLYYAMPTQIAGILPSNTPVGTGQITVTYNGQTSAVASIKVVQSAFGMLTQNQAGTGPALALDANNDYLSFTNAANPGDSIQLWGSGLGPTTGDETQLPVQQDLTNVPVEVQIGGVKSTVSYHGRSVYPGVDRIVVKVPTGVSGCYVSVAVLSASNTIASNFATIPVAASGKTCSDQSSGMTATQTQTLSSKSSVAMGTLMVGRNSITSPSISIGGVTIPGTTTTADIAAGVFQRYTAAQFQSAVQTAASLGSCAVYNYFATNGPSVTTVYNPAYLNAGSAIFLGLPTSSKINLALANSVYGSGSNINFMSATGGTYTFDNGSGGADIGAFSTSLTLGAPMTWSNASSISTVNRSQGVTVNWTGGGTDTYVQISGYSTTGTGGSDVGGYFVCTAPVSAGTFTIPSSILLSLPPSGTVTTGGISTPVYGALSVSNYTNAKQFTAPGLDFGVVIGFTTSSKSLAYQ